jgi:ABC-type multidrug transport system permease subunit
MASQTYRPLVELVKTRLREFLREKGVLFWVFGFPLLMAMGLGLAFRAKIPDKPRVILVTNGEAALAGKLLGSPELAATTASREEARRSLVTAKTDLMVELSSGSNGAPTVHYTYDPQQEKSVWARTVTDDVVERALGRVDLAKPVEHHVTEQGSRYIDFLLPGLIGMNLMGTSMWGVGYNLVVARKRKLLRRYAVTPMSRAQFLLSYFLSRSIFLLLELTILVCFGWLVFDTIVKGHFVVLVAMAFLGAASFAGISLLIGARVDNTESANGWMNLIQLPMWVLSGTFFSYERFPEWLHFPIRCLPLTALSDGLRRIYNQGANPHELGMEIAVLVAWGLAGYLVALRHFRWQ